MRIKVLYNGCWISLSTKNFDSIRDLEDFIKEAATQLKEATTWPVSQTNIL